MKKILLLAAAVLSMVACKDQEEPSIIQPGKQCTLTATIDLDQANQTMARRIKPVLTDTTGTGVISLEWEVGDKVTLSNEAGTETQEFTVASVTSDGKTATLTGTALSDMSSYKVSYGDTDGTVDYAEGTFKPIITGTGVNDVITLNSYCPVLELKLTGNSKISSIQYYVGSDLKTTLNFGDDGLQLTSTAKTVYFPVSAVAGNASDAHLDFVGSDNGNSYAIQRQTIPTALAANTFLTCPALDIHEGLCFTALADGVEISLSGEDGSDFPSLQYFKTGDDEWTTIETEYEFEGMNVTLSKGEKLYVKASDNVTNTQIGYYNDYNKYKPLSFSIIGNTKVSGNIMYLLSSTLATTELTSANAYCFSSLFYSEDLYSDESGLTDAGDLILPATTLADYCYNSMFEKCANLSKAPELPATTLVSNCYRSMFRDCTSLTKAPELPATTLAESCYNTMFRGCTSLTKAPGLPAKTLVKSCYFTMFYGCTGLTEAPEISATKVAEECCQSMFNGCSSLTQAPDLKAEKLAEECYYSMFNNCSKLSSVTMLATDVSAERCLSNWLVNAGTSASTKNLYVASGMQSNSTISQYSSGWSISEKK